MEQEKAITIQEGLSEDQKALVGFTDLRDLASKSASEKIAALKTVTSYVGAPTESIDDYVGVVLEVTGAVIHPATVKQDDGSELEVNRVVFKLKDGKNIAFASAAAADFVEHYLFPLFGQGDFIEDGQPVTIPIVVNRVKTRKGYRTFNFQVV
ncbi:hypothetical protein [Alicyclobacillus kakegawensis]|uniref:hypothetical protein n=1 Tax=Alicyclobacillus kakegawensis TaxID=392012 RepID=UPI0008351736|nr:hypothetical protein [Alicyclobacillus kakegawensis]